MAKEKDKPTGTEAIPSADFDFVLKELLAAYKPLLKKDLDRADHPEELKKEADKTISCEDELALANQIFEKFFHEKMVARLLPAEAREILGPVEQWRWCLFHVRCCVIFGWLICRGQRTFRALIYYLYRFWLCVRQAIGRPVGAKLTDDEREDFRTLVGLLAKAYQPFLTHQVSDLESPPELPDEVTEGKIDCLEGQEETGAIFERLLTFEAAQALFGKEFFQQHSQERFFWFCRCWCLCSIRFGCCLARARDLLDVVRCLRSYFLCLRQCIQPLVCELTDPQDCVPEEVNTVLNAFVVPVEGAAGGGGFDHYVLEWSKDGIIWQTSDFHYPPIPPGGGTQGNIPVFGGLLAYFDTTAKDPGFYFRRMTVTSITGATKVCTTQFSLFKQDVRILGVSGFFNLDKPATDPTAKFVETVPALCTRPSSISEVSFGECLRVWGSAYVGGCEGKKIKRYLLDYKMGCETDPLSPGWTNFWKVEYNTIWQYRDMNMRKDTSALTSNWVTDCVVPVPFPPFCLHSEPEARLAPSCWPTHWATCQLSGQITLRLVVEDTDGNLYYDSQCLWVDNKHICAMIRIDAVGPCQDIYLSNFAMPPDCNVPWPLPLSGIAYDEYIDELLPLTRPNDNFDYYTVSVAKQGGAWVSIPIPGPGFPLAPLTPCYHGTSRVGDPGTRCNPCDPAHPDPTAVFGTLAQFDLRWVDPICKPLGVPDDFVIARGECCVYLFKVYVQDRTIFSGGPHWREAFWPVRICNDLPG